MPFTVPNFNLSCNQWRPPNVPPDPPTDFLACQLYLNSRVAVNILPGDFTRYVPVLYLRVPFGTDLQVNDVIEVEAGSAWFYTVRWVERVHLGFPNEYFVGVLEQRTPVVLGELLLEDGTPIFLEDGTPILLE